jgi:hypothetical protein
MVFLVAILFALPAFAHGDKKHVIGTIEKISPDSVMVKTQDGRSVMKLTYGLSRQETSRQILECRCRPAGGDSCRRQRRRAGRRDRKILRRHGCARRNWSSSRKPSGEI